jgi:peroxiredoxin
MSTNISQLPPDLPVPVDDGAARHLEGALLPALVLPSTDGSTVNLKDLAGRWVIYVYPMTGQPGVALPDGWDGIPGARGCTPQSCSFRDHYAELQALHTNVFGLSSQTTEYQREARERLHLPFHLLSDSTFQLKQVMRFPTFEADGTEFFKRLALIVDDGCITKLFYPVFPPDQNADQVLAWLRQNS